ncbi:preQ(1) synthase [Campylobacter pinnipediorum]|uniref:preQ(1) synthase n=1 Tax=Campylobacter pinnipediorum TaxID=1965231 RepID=UPI00084CF37F|nr:preQ(1) synthase [Campylobacter pinnipediorum]
MQYGEEIIKEFDVERDLEVWENKNEREFVIRITLPEFCCLCPRSGYPDFATIYVDYVPDKLVVELKAIKLYINSFMSRKISHEDSINEIYSAIEKKIQPKWMKIVGDFNPRGNVHTVIEICSESFIKEKKVEAENRQDNRSAGARRINERENDRKRDFAPRRNDRRDSFRGNDRDRGDRGSFRGGDRDRGNSRDRGDRDRGSSRGDSRDRSGGGSRDGYRKIQYENNKQPNIIKKD